MRRRGFLQAVIGGVAAVVATVACPIGEASIRKTIKKNPKTKALAKRWWQRGYKHPIGGKLLSISFSTNHHMEHMYELGLNSPLCRYVEFPIETEVKVVYEHGKETWSGFNIPESIQAKAIHHPHWFLGLRKPHVVPSGKYKLEEIKVDDSVFKIASYEYTTKRNKPCKEEDSSETPSQDLEQSQPVVS